MRTFDRTLSRTGVLQVDSVNVLQRAHYMPLFSRMGPYDVELLRRAAERKPRRMVEYWAHVQAFMPVELWPVMRHRMDHYRAERGKWLTADDDPAFEAERAGRGARARAVPPRATSTTERREHGRLGLELVGARKVLDYLYMSGQIAIARRNGQFEVVYDLPERVLPRRGARRRRRRPSRTRASSWCAALRGPHGVGSAQCLRRLLPDAAPSGPRPAIAQLVEDGELLPVTVEGWKRPAYLHRDARLPRRVDARALLSPFDPVVWERARTEALFDFHYRIEIYVPADKRRTATTCCRSCSATGSSPGSTSRPTGRRRGCWSRRRTPSRAHPPRPPTELAAELRDARGLAGPGRHRGRAAWRPGAGAHRSLGRRPPAG